MVDRRGALACTVRRARTGAGDAWARARRRPRSAALAVVVAVVAALVLTVVLVPGAGSPRSSAATDRGTTGERPEARTGGRDAGSGDGAPTARPTSAPSGRPGSTARPSAPASGPSTPAGAVSSARAGAPEVAGAVGVATPSPSGVGQEVALGALRATVVSVEPVAVDARGPGEIAGPGAAVRLRVRNTSTAPADLAGLAVTASSPDGVPAVPSGGEPAEPLAGALPPGEQRSGTYVFALPRGAAQGPSSLRVEVGSDAAREVAVVLAP